MLELNTFRNDLIHSLFNKAHKRLGTGYLLAGTEWDWNASLWTVRLVFFPLHSYASFLFDLEISPWISIPLFWNRAFHVGKTRLLLFFSLWLWPELSNRARGIYPLQLVFSIFIIMEETGWVVNWSNIYMYFLNSQENSDPSSVDGSHQYI